MADDRKKDEDALGPLPGGRHGLSRRHVAQSQRARLLRGVVDAVGSKGYAATTIADIASLADVSKKTFYIHFDDKQQCFLAAYDAFAGYLLGEMGTRYRQTTGDWQLRYPASVETYLALLAARPERSRALMHEVLAAGPEVLTCRRKVLKSFEDMLADIHRGARRKDPSVPNIPRELFTLNVGGVDELVRSFIVAGKAPLLPTLAPTIALNFAWLMGRRALPDALAAEPG